MLNSTCQLRTPYFPDAHPAQMVKDMTCLYRKPESENSIVHWSSLEVSAQNLSGYIERLKELLDVVSIFQKQLNDTTYRVVVAWS